LPQQSVFLRFNGDSVLPYPLPRAFVYYHLKNTLLLAILHTGRTLNFTLPLLDSDRHFVNGLLVCIDPTNALLHESGPF
jgi:hypothetical protein